MINKLITVIEREYRAINRDSMGNVRPVLFLLVLYALVVLFSG